MRILRSLAIALVLALLPASAAATGLATGGADPDPNWTGRSMAQYDAEYFINEDGTVDVTIDFVFDFGDNPGHGPQFSYPTRVAYDTSNDRFFPVSDIRASSPTAPANVYVEQGKYWVDIRIGDENIGNVSGAHEYRLTYTVDALLNATYGGELADYNGSDSTHVYDEFYVDVIGGSWRVPFRDVTITIAGEGVEAIEGGCSSGSYGEYDACSDFRISPDGAVIAVENYIAPYEPMTIGVWFPPGSFDTEPIVRTKNDLAYAFSLNPVTGAGATAVLGAGALLLTRRIRSSALDEQYAGYTPGVGPIDLEGANIVKRDYKAPVAVAFEPPPGLRPGQLGTLIDEQADKRDVTATIIDLAVRGYLVIEEVGDGKKKPKKVDYKLIKKRDADDAMLKYERTLFDGLFKKGDEVELDDLKTTFLSTMQSVQKQMYKDATAMGWFRGNPQNARGAWLAAGVVIVVLGVLATFFVGNMGPWALIPLPIAIIGVMVMATSRNAPARTAEGTKVLVQTLGFETFLETADANMLKWEEGRDIFSRYLPYAIAFDVADKWADTFAKLAKQGANLPEPTWYNGVVYGSLWHSTGNIGGLSDRISSFTSMADSAISAPTPSSSGGSFGSSGGGFSGGGFSGGGSFGGGGGGW